MTEGKSFSGTRSGNAEGVYRDPFHPTLFIEYFNSAFLIPNQEQTHVGSLLDFVISKGKGISS